MTIDFTQNYIKMEIDLFSIIVVVIAFSLFAIPIAIDKMRNKKQDESQETN